VEQGRTEERFALCEDFIGGGTVVGSRLVIERRQLLRRRDGSIGGGGSSSGGSERRKGGAVAGDCNGCLERALHLRHGCDIFDKLNANYKA